MYGALHNAEQMLPHLETIDLPDPLPDMHSMNVICYDFVPQLHSILQNPEMMSGNNLVLDPNNPLAMYKPHDGRLGEALSGSMYQDMYHLLLHTFVVHTRDWHPPYSGLAYMSVACDQV
jgi:hypothetical protein